MGFGLGHAVLGFLVIFSTVDLVLASPAKPKIPGLAIPKLKMVLTPPQLPLNTAGPAGVAGGDAPAATARAALLAQHPDLFAPNDPSMCWRRPAHVVPSRSLEDLAKATQDLVEKRPVRAVRLTPLFTGADLATPPIPLSPTHPQMAEVKLVRRLGDGGNSMGAYFAALESHPLRAAPLSMSVFLKVVQNDPVAAVGSRRPDRDPTSSMEREAHLQAVAAAATTSVPQVLFAGLPHDWEPTSILITESIETYQEKPQDHADHKYEFTAEQFVRVAESLISGVQAIHSRGIMHNDLTRANVKILSDHTVKIIDFGEACLFAFTPSGPTDPRFKYTCHQFHPHLALKRWASAEADFSDGRLDAHYVVRTLTDFLFNSKFSGTAAQSEELQKKLLAALRVPIPPSATPVAANMHAYQGVHADDRSESPKSSYKVCADLMHASGAYLHHIHETATVLVHNADQWLDAILVSLRAVH